MEDLNNPSAKSLLENALAEFAAGIGHELNNPLASIGGRVQLLMRETPDMQLRRDLAEICSEVQRAGDLIADIRLYACPPEPQITQVNLTAILNQTAESFQSELTEKQIQLVCSGLDSPLTVSADPVQLDVLFRAVIRNAKESLENSTQTGIKQIGIELKSSGDCVKVVISDNGPGLTSDQLLNAFNPYYSARQANRGLGFGLCKAQKIASRNHIALEMESVPAVQTRVTICFEL